MHFSTRTAGEISRAGKCDPTSTRPQTNTNNQHIQRTTYRLPMTPHIFSSVNLGKETWSLLMGSFEHEWNAHGERECSGFRQQAGRSSFFFFFFSWPMHGLRMLPRDTASRGVTVGLSPAGAIPITKHYYHPGLISAGSCQWGSSIQRIRSVVCRI
jgi:hypothetical protein